MKKILPFIWEIAKIAIIACVIVLPIRYFLFQPFFVKGESMEPNFRNGDYLIIDEISYNFRNPQRGEVIVFKYPNDPSQRFIKRIIGLPGETVNIKNNTITITNQGGESALNESSYLPSSILTPDDGWIKLNNDEYFVMGDNRAYSYDSRSWGALPKKNIIGKVLIRAFPFASLTKFTQSAY